MNELENQFKYIIRVFCRSRWNLLMSKTVPFLKVMHNHEGFYKAIVNHQEAAVAVIVHNQGLRS